MADRIEIELVFDPIFGQQSKEKLVKESGKTGAKSGEKFSKEFGSQVGKSFKGVSKRLGDTLTVFAGVALNDLFRSVKSIISEGVRGSIAAVKSFEKIEVGLKILTGSAEKASEVIKDLQEFAATTPFQLEGIAGAANQLIAFGFEADSVIERLQKIGDVAAGSNSDLKEVALIYGQVAAAGKLTGERLLQFQERAIPIGAALAKSLGVAESKVKDLVSAGKVGFPEFEKAFNSLSESGGLFAGALAAQSQTVSGILSTLSDNFFNLQIQLGQTFKPAILSTANEFISIFRKFSADVASNGPLLVRTFERLADVFVVTPAKFWADLLTGGDATKNIQQINKEAAILSARFDEIQAELTAERSSVGDAIFNSIIGRKGQLEDELVDVITRLGELRQLQDEFSAITPKTEVELFGILGIPTPQQMQQVVDGYTNIALLQESFTAPKIDPVDQAALDSLTLFGIKLDNVMVKANKFAVDWQKVSKSIKDSAVQGIGKGVASGFAAVGAALVNGENALKAFGKAFAAAIGQAAIQLGTRFILEGVAISFNPFLGGPAVGGPLIAAGAALATFGGALGAVVGGGGGGAAGGAGGGAVNAGFSESIAEEDVTEEAVDQTSVSVVIQGDVLDSEESGMRIANILNDAFDKQGVVVKGAA